MVREAHELLCSYAPEYLDSERRSAWPGEHPIEHLPRLQACGGALDAKDVHI